MTTQTLDRPTQILEQATLALAAEHTHYCVAQTYAGSALEPAEYCENEVAEEDAFCEDHGGDALEEAQERAYTTWKENR